MLAYLVAIESYPMQAVMAAAKAFLSGKVKRENKTFAPSAPEFADECRAQQMAIEAALRPRIEPPAEKRDDGPKVDPRKLQLLNKALKGHNPSRAKLRRMFPHLDIPDAPVSEGEQP
ncbi:hypothetical protein [Rhizobium hidalgonense]|uniref:hypothetical protein n=1 Tax=Rhizobium hidalgonense TaxID=1538159 RepID=UPI002870E0B5|nr:hypothetical protein [Rhizobium hidalgonense]MDR9813093.1 hypothetical protein [Rhizobium hidalgonense]